MRSILLLALAAIASASPISDAENEPISDVEKRQSFGTSWENEPYIKKPQNFQVRSAGATCDFQLVYERDPVDNRYDVQYLAEYADGSTADVKGIRGTLPRDSVWNVAGLPEGRGIQAVFFQNICKNGASPRSFRANFSLRSGFTYQNRWTTGSFGLTTNALPAAPSNVRVSASSQSSTVTWRSVSGATGYVVLVEWLVNSEVGPLPFVWAREVTGGSSTSFSYNRKFTRAAVVAINGGTLAGGAKLFTPLDDVADVRPS